MHFQNILLISKNSFHISNIETVYSNRTSPKNDLLQVFIGNIPQEVNEDDIRRIFSRFGHLTRVRLHANPRKDWLPLYAFISYDNVQSVRQCLMKKVCFRLNIIKYSIKSLLYSIRITFYGILFRFRILFTGQKTHVMAIN